MYVCIYIYIYINDAAGSVLYWKIKPKLKNRTDFFYKPNDFSVLIFPPPSASETRRKSVVKKISPHMLL